MDIRCVNSLVLAYLGDAVYEEYIRMYLVEKNINKVNDLQRESINYVSAKRQAYFIDKMLMKIELYDIFELKWDNLRKEEDDAKQSICKVYWCICHRRIPCKCAFSVLLIRCADHSGAASKRVCEKSDGFGQ